ncbi:MAG: DNA-binding protein [Actinobacteria bacterium]|nr:MAG: DNA-binding protein [Actinomycetota bacterium]
MAYDFTLRFRLTDATISSSDRVERLFEAGCDDALVGAGQAGKMALAFTRSAASAREAVLSAISDARGAMPDAQLIGASPDLVGLTEVAGIMGFSRQNMRKLIVGSGEHAPASVHESTPSLWHLSDMLAWLSDRGYAVDPAIAEVAGMTKQVNIAMQCAAADPGAQREIAEALA